LSIARSTVSLRPAFSSPARPDRLHDAVQNLAVVDLDHILAALEAERLHRVGGHHADLRVRATLEAPTVSASNCMNWRKRPGPGFSFRNTQPER
jgi:hypothetical protein